MNINNIESTKNQQRDERIKRLELLKKMGVSPYASKFDKKQNILEVRNTAIGSVVQTAGRIMLLRNIKNFTDPFSNYYFLDSASRASFFFLTSSRTFSSTFFGRGV